MKQRLNVVVGALLLAIAGQAAAQQTYPSKPIRIIVPLVPGGSTNNISRFIADKMKETLGQLVVVENRPGGNSVIGSEAVARAAPDGYTLLVNSGTHVILPFVEPKLPFDVLKDFAPVATLSRVRYTMVVHPSMPAKTVKEFIAFAKSRPGQINFAASGTASGSRIAGEVFNLLGGVKMQMIPYKGGAQAVADLIGGHVQVAFNSPNLVAPLVGSGRLRALAVSGESRVSVLPQVPTFIEAGMPAYKEIGWQGLWAPAATPSAVIDRLNGEVAKIQNAPDMKSLYEKQGLESFISTPGQFDAILKEESAKIAKLVKEANLKFQSE
jgi:tripartite-type tricarboxylate transporter receptor subunit TctC